MDIPVTFAEARPLLVARPVGRIPLGIRALRLALDDAADALDATSTVAGDVLIGLVLDLDGADVPVTDTMLKQWGVTLEQAITVSFDVHGAEDPRLERVEGALVVTDRSYAAFLLQRPAEAARLVGGGTPVAIVPTDRHVVLAVAEQLGSLVTAARIAEQLVGDPEARLVSSSALFRTDAGWAPVHLPQAAEPAGSDLRRRFSAVAYGLQRPLLQAFYDRSSQDCFVADAVLVRTAQGETRLVATITEGVPTALPWVDDVSLVRAGATAGFVPMTQLAGVDGLLAPLDDLEPPRYYPTRFPAEFAR